MFIDSVHLIVKAGCGGNGCDSHFKRRDKKIIPTGGDGGKGGDVIFACDEKLTSIAHLRLKGHLVAEFGANGSSNKKRGKTGKDLIVSVPVGTRITNRQHGFLIRELKTPGERVLICKGGNGGSGNLGGKEAKPGKEGDAFEIELIYRLHADVFMIGLPNSGKSTLLNTLTRTHAKTENYPFATKSPEIGVYHISDYERLSLCELPSLYETSHEGHGLGNDFLKHLETAVGVILVIDPVSQFAGSLKEGYEKLKKQIELYNPEFLKLTSAVIVTKIDEVAAKEKAEHETWSCPEPVFYLSATQGEGLDALKLFLNQNIYPLVEQRMNENTEQKPL